MSEEVQQVNQASDMSAQIVTLRTQRRSRNDFLKWRPDIFYYLFSLMASLAVAWLTGGASFLDLQGSITAGLCFVSFCYAPILVNRVRFWVVVRRPNRLLQRKIDFLETQIRHLQAGR